MKKVIAIIFCLFLGITNSLFAARGHEFRPCKNDYGLFEAVVNSKPEEVLDILNRSGKKICKNGMSNAFIKTLLGQAKRNFRLKKTEIFLDHPDVPKKLSREVVDKAFSKTMYYCLRNICTKFLSNDVLRGEIYKNDDTKELVENGLNYLLKKSKTHFEEIVSCPDLKERLADLECVKDYFDGSYKHLDKYKVKKSKKRRSKRRRDTQRGRQKKNVKIKEKKRKITSLKRYRKKTREYDYGLYRAVKLRKKREVSKILRTFCSEICPNAIDDAFNRAMTGSHRDDLSPEIAMIFFDYPGVPEKLSGEVLDRAILKTMHHYSLDDIRSKILENDVLRDRLYRCDITKASIESSLDYLYWNKRGRFKKFMEHNDLVKRLAHLDCVKDFLNGEDSKEVSENQQVPQQHETMTGQDFAGLPMPWELHNSFNWSDKEVQELVEQAMVVCQEEQPENNALDPVEKKQTRKRRKRKKSFLQMQQRVSKRYKRKECENDYGLYEAVEDNQPEEVLNILNVHGKQICENGMSNAFIKSFFGQAKRDFKLKIANIFLDHPDVPRKLSVEVVNRAFSKTLHNSLRDIRTKLFKHDVLRGKICKEEKFTRFVEGGLNYVLKKTPSHFKEILSYPKLRKRLGDLECVQAYLNGKSLEKYREGDKKSDFVEFEGNSSEDYDETYVPEDEEDDFEDVESAASDVDEDEEVLQDEEGEDEYGLYEAIDDDKPKKVLEILDEHGKQISKKEMSDAFFSTVCGGNRVDLRPKVALEFLKHPDAKKKLSGKVLDRAFIKSIHRNFKDIIYTILDDLDLRAELYKCKDTRKNFDIALRSLCKRREYYLPRIMSCSDLRKRFSQDVREHIFCEKIKVEDKRILTLLLSDFEFRRDLSRKILVDIIDCDDWCVQIVWRYRDLKQRVINIREGKEDIPASEFKDETYVPEDEEDDFEDVESAASDVLDDQEVLQDDEEGRDSIVHHQGFLRQAYVEPTNVQPDVNDFLCDLPIPQDHSDLLKQQNAQSVEKILTPEKQREKTRRFRPYVRKKAGNDYGLYDAAEAGQGDTVRQIFDDHLKELNGDHLSDAFYCTMTAKGSTRVNTLYPDVAEIFLDYPGVKEKLSEEVLDKMVAKTIRTHSSKLFFKIVRDPYLRSKLYKRSDTRWIFDKALERAGQRNPHLLDEILSHDDLRIRLSRSVKESIVKIKTRSSYVAHSNEEIVALLRYEIKNGIYGQVDELASVQQSHAPIVLNRVMLRNTHVDPTNVQRNEVNNPLPLFLPNHSDLLKQQNAESVQSIVPRVHDKAKSVKPKNIGKRPTPKKQRERSVRRLSPYYRRGDGKDYGLYKAVDEGKNETVQEILDEHHEKLDADNLSDAFFWSMCRVHRSVKDLHPKIAEMFLAYPDVKEKLSGDVLHRVVVRAMRKSKWDLFLKIIRDADLRSKLYRRDNIRDSFDAVLRATCKKGVRFLNEVLSHADLRKRLSRSIKEHILKVKTRSKKVADNNKEIIAHLRYEIENGIYHEYHEETEGSKEQHTQAPIVVDQEEEHREEHVDSTNLQPDEGMSNDLPFDLPMPPEDSEVLILLNQQNTDSESIVPRVHEEEKRQQAFEPKSLSPYKRKGTGNDCGLYNQIEAGSWQRVELILRTYHAALNGNDLSDAFYLSMNMNHANDVCEAIAEQFLVYSDVKEKLSGEVLDRVFINAVFKGLTNLLLKIVKDSNLRAKLYRRNDTRDSFDKALKHACENNVHLVDEIVLLYPDFRQRLSRTIKEYILNDKTSGRNWLPEQHKEMIDLLRHELENGIYGQAGEQPSEQRESSQVPEVSVQREPSFYPELLVEQDLDVQLPQTNFNIPLSPIDVNGIFHNDFESPVPHEYEDDFIMFQMEEPEQALGLTQAVEAKDIERVRRILYGDLDEMNRDIILEAFVQTMQGEEKEDVSPEITMVFLDCPWVQEMLSGNELDFVVMRSMYFDFKPLFSRVIENQKLRAKLYKNKVTKEKIDNALRYVLHDEYYMKKIMQCSRLRKRLSVAIKHDILKRQAMAEVFWGGNCDVLKLLLHDVEYRTVLEEEIEPLSKILYFINETFMKRSQKAQDAVDMVMKTFCKHMDLEERILAVCEEQDFTFILTRFNKEQADVVFD